MRHGQLHVFATIAATLLSIVSACVPSNPTTGETEISPAPSEIVSSPTPSHPEEITGEKGVPMRLVPAGGFTMGSELNDNEKPVHIVNLEAFYIDKYEVTNQAYGECVDAGVCRPPGTTSSLTHEDYYNNPAFSHYPLIYATWVMADKYCRWRDARLPTEAEWEKAARGEDSRIYPWGNDFGCNYANMVIQNKPCVGDTTPVGSYEKGISPYGLHDMSGNVGEWTSSILKPYPYDTNDGREDPSVLKDHIVRGGSWYYMDETISRVTSRDALNSMRSDPDIGIRCVMEVNQ